MSDNENAVEKAESNLPAVSNTDLMAGFGGPEAAVPPIEVSWPVIQMTKTSDFKMPDGSKVSEVIGHMLFAQRSRAYYEKDFDGNNDRPDCASSNGVSPDSGDKRQGDMCVGCPKAEWVKYFDDNGKEKNKMDCGESLNVMFLPDGKVVPHYIRIRSTSIGKKSKMAIFFGNCLDPEFALERKYQTVQVRFTLNEQRINNFERSILVVEKIKTLEPTDERLPLLMKLYNEVAKDFTVKHDRGDEAKSNDGPAGDGGGYPTPDYSNGMEEEPGFADGLDEQV